MGDHAAMLHQPTQLHVDQHQKISRTTSATAFGVKISHLTTATDQLNTSVQLSQFHIVVLISIFATRYDMTRDYLPLILPIFARQRN